MDKIFTVLVLTFTSLVDVNYNYLFHHFQNEYNKTYSIEEFDKRFEIFKDNIDFIVTENQKENNYTLGINKFTDLTLDEYKNNFVKLDSNLQSNYLSKRFGKKCKVMTYNQVDLPKDIDWRSHDAVTSVKNQGQCGSCWSFSATGAIEGANAIYNNDLISLSEQQLVDCSSEYGNHACNGGLMDNAFEYVEDYGLCTEEDYPYQASKGTCMSSDCKSAVTLRSCFDVPQNNELMLKEAVSQQPISVAIEADTRVFQMYTSGVITGDACGTNLDHGVLVVGYGNEDGVDYWLVKNSWGTSWGDDGYVKIERSDSTNDPGVCGIAMQPSYPQV